ncbi:MAG TPA: hypothetical protein VF077_06185 [Nitrospiraceae bacterium]
MTNGKTITVTMHRNELAAILGIMEGADYHEIRRKKVNNLHFANVIAKLQDAREVLEACIGAAQREAREQREREAAHTISKREAAEMRELMESVIDGESE